MGAGFLGFVTGFIRTTQFIQQVPTDERLAILLLGVGESAHNIGLALFFLIPTQIVIGLTASRADSQG